MSIGRSCFFIEVNYMYDFDFTFFVDEYSSTLEIDSNEWKALNRRAGRLVDAITGMKILHMGGLDKLHPTQLRLVKFAICSQVEYLLENGETSATTEHASGDGYTIGAYTERPASVSKGGGPRVVYSADVLNYLIPTGLLYAGVKRHDSSY